MMARQQHLTEKNTYEVEIILVIAHLAVLIAALRGLCGWAQL
jgi:hypothetical protein